MAFERFLRGGSYGSVFLNCKVPPVFSKSHTIIEDYRDAQYHYTSPMTPQKVFLPSEQYYNATKDEYRGSSWPQTTSHASTRPPPQVVNMEYHQVPNHTNKRPVEGSSSEKIINCIEAAKMYRGYVITEYRDNKK
ncbi:hypothetical protein ACLB2K_037329 [Fragaria x ananassa]